MRGMPRIAAAVALAFCLLPAPLAGCARDADAIRADPSTKVPSTASPAPPSSSGGPFSDLVGVNPRYDARQLLTAGKLIQADPDAGSTDASEN